MAKWVFLFLFLPVSAYAQPNWPGLRDLRLNNTVHDLGHAGAASLVVAGTGWLTDWPLATRTVLGTVAWPIAVETYDFLYWTRGNIKRVNWDDKLQDVLGYQLPWAYYLAKRGRWWLASYVVALYGTFLYWQNYGKRDPFHVTALALPIPIALEIAL